MKKLTAVFCVSSLCLSLCVLGQANAQQARQLIDPNWNYEPQIKGPVHEAFAQPFEAQPQPGPMVPSKPPDPIPETPPDMTPPGKDVQWIPGYWAWDSEKGEFLWVSGTYRHAPPGRQYVPGYWTQEGNGWRWVQGYWAPSGQPDAGPPAPQYTPQPPAPLQTGPALPGPNDGIYNPGYWAYQNNTFAWRPGSYYQGVPGKMWIPPHYVWTPAGYVFVPGYWDYPLEDRGLLFAPLSFTGPLWSDPNWSYTPNYAINTGLLLDNLFCCGPSFWFGNCYGLGGFSPWYNGYGPYAGYYGWLHRGDPGWRAGLQRNYLARANGRLAVPGRADLIRPLSGVANLNRLNQAQIHANRLAAARSRDLAQQRFRNEVRQAHVNPGHVGNAAGVQPGRPAVHASAPRVITHPAAGQNHPAVHPPVNTVHHTPTPVHHTAPAHAAPAHHAAAAHHAAPAHHPAPAHHAAANHHASSGHHSSGHRH